MLDRQSRTTLLVICRSGIVLGAGPHPLNGASWEVSQPAPPDGAFFVLVPI